MKKPVNNWIIIGTQHNDQAFRPSDWAGRICELDSVVQHSGIVKYSEDLRPIRYNGHAAVYVDSDLRDNRTKVWEEVMAFASLHQLKVVEYADPVTTFHGMLKPSTEAYLQQHSERIAA